MSDHERRLADIEKRLARLENAEWKREEMKARALQFRQEISKTADQFCQCGRDVCRAPDCPSHRRENNCGNDPLGR
jgi:hypothetical protein